MNFLKNREKCKRLLFCSPIYPPPRFRIFCMFPYMLYLGVWTCTHAKIRVCVYFIFIIFLLLKLRIFFFVATLPIQKIDINSLISSNLLALFTFSKLLSKMPLKSSSEVFQGFFIVFCFCQNPIKIYFDYLIVMSFFSRVYLFFFMTVTLQQIRPVIL